MVHIIYPTGVSHTECIRILVKNNSHIAARECKGYFVLDIQSERVCWTLPTERPNATINVNDIEKLDFCAFPQGTRGDDTLILPTEDGWDNLRRISLIEPVTNCKVRVTAENAEMVEANVVICRDEQRIEIK